MRRAKIPVERQRPLQFADRSRSAIGEDLDEAQPHMRPMIARRDRNALDQQRLGLGQTLSSLVGGEDRADQDVGSRGAHKGVNVGRIERHGALEMARAASMLSTPPLLNR